VYICLCHAVTEGEIRAAADAGHDSVEALGNCLGVTTGCGQCECMVSDILEEQVELRQSNREHREQRHPLVLRPALSPA
jgi:bacterioferritin-associated ferredoxin